MNGETTVIGINVITDAVGDIFTIMGEVLKGITGNTYLMLCLGAAVVIMGLRIFSRAKRAVR
jgi:hypothetical protein